jgi:hypothetical protein
MDRVAVITDIHANLPALEAALGRIDELGVETVYCGGDLVGYGPHPNDVCALIESRAIPTIYGNYDYAIGRELEDCGCAYRDPHDGSPTSSRTSMSPPPDPLRGRAASIGQRLLELVRTLAKRLGDRCARTEHLLLAAVSPALKSPAGTVLADCGADATRVCEQLASMLEIEAPELAARLRPPRRRLRRRASVPS